MRVVCAWCGADLGEKEGDFPGLPGAVSHDICPPCRDRLIAGAARAEEVCPLDELEAHADRLRRRPMIGTGEAKVYTGIRRGDGCRVTVNGEPLPLRLDLANHSPTGFAWGYGGSGPTQLALAILADYTGDDAEALEIYHEFVRRCIVNLPHEAWTLTGSTVKIFVDACHKGLAGRAPG